MKYRCQICTVLGKPGGMVWYGIIEPWEHYHNQNRTKKSKVRYHRPKRNVNKFIKNSAALKSGKLTNYTVIDKENRNLDFDTSFINISSKMADYEVSKSNLCSVGKTRMYRMV